MSEDAERPEVFFHPLLQSTLPMTIIYTWLVLPYLLVAESALLRRARGLPADLACTHSNNSVVHARRRSILRHRRLHQLAIVLELI